MPNQLIQTARRQWAAVQNETIEEANTAGRVGKAGHAILDALEFSTPYIGTNGNWWVGAADTGTPAQGEPGAKGDKGGKGDTGTDGRGIESINTDDNNHLIVKYTDGNLHDAGVMQNRRKLFSFNTADYVDDSGALPGGYLFRLLEWTPNTYVGSSSGYTQFEKLPNFELNIAMKSDNTNNNAKLTNGKFIFLTAGQYEYDYDLAKPLSDSGYGFIYRFSGNINDVGSQYIIFEAEGYGYPTIAMMVTPDLKIQLWIISFNVTNNDPKNTIFECDIQWYNDLEPQIVVESGGNISPDLYPALEVNAFAPTYKNLRTQVRANYNEINRLEHSKVNRNYDSAPSMLGVSFNAASRTRFLRVPRGSMPLTISVSFLSYQVPQNSEEFIIEPRESEHRKVMSTRASSVVNPSNSSNPDNRFANIFYYSYDNNYIDIYVNLNYYVALTDFSVRVLHNPNNIAIDSSRETSYVPVGVEYPVLNVNNSAVSKYSDGTDTYISSELKYVRFLKVRKEFAIGLKVGLYFNDRNQHTNVPYAELIINGNLKGTTNGSYDDARSVMYSLRLKSEFGYGLILWNYITTGDDGYEYIEVWGVSQITYPSAYGKFIPRVLSNPNRVDLEVAPAYAPAEPVYTKKFEIKTVYPDYTFAGASVENNVRFSLENQSIKARVDMPYEPFPYFSRGLQAETLGNGLYGMLIPFHIQGGVFHRVALSTGSYTGGFNIRLAIITSSAKIIDGVSYGVNEVVAGASVAETYGNFFRTAYLYKNLKADGMSTTAGNIVLPEGVYYLGIIVDNIEARFYSVTLKSTVKVSTNAGLYSSTDIANWDTNNNFGPSSVNTSSGNVEVTRVPYFKLL